MCSSINGSHGIVRHMCILPIHMYVITKKTFLSIHRALYRVCLCAAILRANGYVLAGVQSSNRQQARQMIGGCDEVCPECLSSICLCHFLMHFCSLTISALLVRLSQKCKVNDKIKNCRAHSPHCRFGVNLALKQRDLPSE